MAKKKKGLSIAALVCSLLFWIPLLSWIFVILGLVLGIVSLVKIKKEPKKYAGKGMAIAAVIISAIIFLLGIITIFAVASGLVGIV